MLLTLEFSEETYGHAATRIHKLLAAQVPATATNDASGSPTLTKAVVEAAVKRVADRVNWGVENGVSVCRFAFDCAPYPTQTVSCAYLGCNYLAAGSQRQDHASTRVPADLRGAMERAEPGTLGFLVSNI